jgi:RNA polymerase sigma-70 factor (ECF subfamily)
MMNAMATAVPAPALELRSAAGDGRGPERQDRREPTSTGAAAAFDPERLGETLAGLHARMNAVARRVVRDPEAAEDVVQNAFEKAVRRISTFDGRALFSTWLHRIVVNEALMWLRTESRRSRRIELTAEGGAEPERHADPDADPARRLFERERIDQLRAGIAALPALERDVLERCALAGESYETYASRAGIGAAAAKSRAYRARQRLRGWLHYPA